MVKHVIIWTLKSEYSEEKKAALKKEMKEAVESLNGKIPGLINVSLITEGLPTSNADFILDSSFEDAEALAVYATHPDHVAVAKGLILPNIDARVCFDYEV